MTERGRMTGSALIGTIILALRLAAIRARVNRCVAVFAVLTAAALLR